MRLLGSGLVAAFGLLCVLAACENQAAPGPGPKPTVPTYTVSFDSDGGTPIAGVKVRKGTVLNLRLKVGDEFIFEPKKPGYFFNGWFLKDDPSPVLRSRTSITVNEDITLVAKWIKYCVVSLEMGEGGTLGGNTELSVLPGTLLEAAGYKPFRKGYIFRYWYLKDDPGTEVRSIRVDKDITLVAVWKEGWAVTLVLNGGTYPRDYITVDKDDATLEVAGIKPVKANSVFEGWYFNGAFTDPVPDEITVTDNSITLYVKWLPLSLFEDLLDVGVWTGLRGTYLLYFEESRLYGFYFSRDEIRSCVWTASTLDGKGYTSGSRTLTVGTDPAAETFTPVNDKRKPAGNARLTGMWIKGGIVQTFLEGDPNAPTTPPVDGKLIYKGGEILVYDFSEGVWLCLNEDGSGYVRADGGSVDITYVVTNLNVLYLLRRNEKVTADGIVLEEGEVLLRIPIVPIIDDEDKEVGIRPDGFEPFGLLPF